MTTVLKVGSATHVGQVRSRNEDSKLVLDKIRLYAVADGMGGHQGGQVASSMAVESIEATLGSKGAETTQDALVRAVEVANRTIHDRAADDLDLRGMGTTFCAIAVVEADDGGDEIAWVNVGDSRIYLFRDDDLHQLSEDHTLVADLRRDGQLTAEEAAVHPQRNIITRALGIDSRVEVDSKRLIALQGDRFLLCSDGLFGEVSSDQICAVLRRLADPHEAADELVRLANEHGGRDNITCVLVDVVDDDGRAAAAEAARAEDAARAKERAAEAAAAGGGLDDADVDDEGTTQPLPVVENADPVAGDLAGFTTPAAPAAEPEPAPEPASKRDAKRAARAEAAKGDADLGFGRGSDDVFADLDQARGRHLTWRVFAFLLALLVVLGVALGAVGWYAKRTYYVGYAGNEVVVYQGQPGGLLFFQPSVKDHTKVHKAQLTDAEDQAVAKQQTFGSLIDARTFAHNLATQVQARIDASTTTTTASTTTTTTRPSPTTTKPPATTRPRGATPTIPTTR